MNIKYKASWSYLTIERFEVAKETETMVIVNDRRHAKLSNREAWFDTFDDAHEWLLRKTEEDAEHCYRRYLSAKKDFEFVSQLKRLD